MVAPETNCASPVTPAAVGSDFGKYKLLAAIGRGGMGEVYLAMSRGPSGFKKLVVLKCLHATNADDEGLRRMFLDEGLIAARLSHQNIVQTYEIGELSGSLYMAMEFLDGQPLSKLKRTRPELCPRLAAHIAANVLAGLHYAHELCDFDGTPLEIVHRDLSPPNIFVTYDGVVKVVDFGIAKTRLVSRTNTEVGILKGKVAYMAPEQATQDEVDRRADIFSVGVVLWELLAGTRLFGGGSTAVTLKRLLQDEIPRVSSIRPKIDPMLDEIVARALQRDIDARYRDALEMRYDLESYLKSGAAITWERELGKLVSERFSEERRTMQQQVQACILEEPVSVARLPSMTRSETPSSLLQARAAASRPHSSGVAGDVPPAVVEGERAAATKPSLSASWRIGLLVAGFAIGLTGVVRHWIAEQSSDLAAQLRRIEPARPPSPDVPAASAARAEGARSFAAASAEVAVPAPPAEVVAPAPRAKDAFHAANGPSARPRPRPVAREPSPSAQTGASPSGSARLREQNRGGAQSARAAPAVSAARNLPSTKDAPSAQPLLPAAPEPHLKTRAQLVPDLPRSKLVE